MSADYRILGSERVRREWIEGDCLRLARWFNRRGQWTDKSTAPDSRSRLWYCLDLLAHGDPKFAALAQQVILATPIDANHFEPFAAIELLLRFPDRLTPRAAAHLKRICSEHYLNSLEVRAGVPGVNNFSTMTTFFLLGASRVLDGYTWDHPLASIPEVYSRERMRDIGMNMLAALAYWTEHQAVINEWNSTNYTPITLHCLAKIVELVDDPEAQEMAAQVEMQVWRQVLPMYHPGLNLQCGPYARAYRHDILGHGTEMRILLSYTGISKDRSVVRLLGESQPPWLPADPDLPFRWAGTAWQLSTRYHVPVDALKELDGRRYPHRFTAPIRWTRYGLIDPKKHQWISVQGPALTGGQGEVVQVQHPRWSLGWRTQATLGHSFPIHLQYAVKAAVRSLRDQRSVTAAVAFHDAPTEWMRDWRGLEIEYSNFNNEGMVEVTEAKKGLAFAARPFPELAGIASDELSLNSFIPLHFAAVDEAAMDGEPFGGQTISRRAKRALLSVRDAGMVYEIEYVFPRPVEIRLYRWANFIRFSGFWYEGPKRFFTPAELEKYSARGRLTVVKAGR